MGSIEEPTDEISLDQHRNRYELKNMVTRFKIDNIVKGFINKLKRTNPYRPVPEHSFEFERESDEGWAAIEGLSLCESFSRFYEVLLVFANVLLIYFSTLNFAFPICTFEWARNIEITTLVFLIVDFCLNLVTTKVVSGVRIRRLGDIADHYLHEMFAIDLTMILLMIVGLVVQHKVIHLLKLVMLLKIPSTLDRLEKLETILI